MAALTAIAGGTVGLAVAWRHPSGALRTWLSWRILGVGAAFIDFGCQLDARPTPAPTPSEPLRMPTLADRAADMRPYRGLARVVRDPGKAFDLGVALGLHRDIGETS